MDEDGHESGKPAPRRVRTRQQIINGEGKRPPASVPLAELAHNPFNPRDELTDIAETADSLKERGQLQPVAVVRRAAFLAVHPGRDGEIGEAEYVVIDGNRRLAAASAAGLPELRIDVNDDLAASAEDLLESALIANVHRVDVPPLDQAKAIQELLGKHGSQEKVAKRLGKSGAWVSQRLALLGLSEDLQEKVEAGELKVKDGRRIGRLPAEQQQSEAAAALNRVKAPRKARIKSVAGSGEEPAASPIPPQNSGTAAPVVPTPESVNPVKGEHETAAVPALPWGDPGWFDTQLRAHMSPEHREELVLLLMADG
ncbi:ParB/RepB/Spo0J family partition protein [uncultured Streptomyces sp.]|uniref:ParB/RepB/Spo0J family partition protein n=1 Tax=uncultured Streptomyces sp. TaxID=174707 RepID=UPI002619CE3D|nr:ParB/RepB/Spo0J family partition protein [uncultured Streptomyces sp.]